MHFQWWKLAVKRKVVACIITGSLSSYGMGSNEKFLHQGSELKGWGSRKIYVPRIWWTYRQKTQKNTIFWLVTPFCEKVLLLAVFLLLYSVQRLYRTQIIWVFSVLDNRLLTDNLSQLPKVSIWLRKVRYVVNTRFFGLLFYSDLTQTDEIRLRHDSDIWGKKWRVKPLM